MRTIASYAIGTRKFGITAREETKWSTYELQKRPE